MTRLIPIATLAAAEWLANNYEEAKTAPSFYFLMRKRFGLSVDQSIKAIAEANRMREGR